MPESVFTTATAPDNEYGRVKLRCRRGTRELDLMLNRFVESEYLSLSTNEKDQFERLLDQQDPILITWLLGQDQPGDSNLARLVDSIRQAFRH